MNIQSNIFSGLVSCIAFVIAINLSGCGSDKAADTLTSSFTNTLTFIPKYENKPLQCFSPFSHQAKIWQYSQLQFFVSEVEVKDQEGQWQTWQFTKNKYQSSEVALLGEYCQNDKIKKQSSHQSRRGNWQLSFEQAIEPSAISQLRFTLGVPFSLNHQNPLLQPSPLNVPNMFWVWHSGHKFFRLDMEEINELDRKDNWQFHLGSTGCKAPSPLRAPKNPCINGNQAKITIDIKTKTQGSGFQSIDVDLTSLFAGFIMTKQNSCQSEPENESCLPLFKVIGLPEPKVQLQSLFTVSHFIKPVSE
ncbi:MAG: metallo-mystery pair system four-Cys motif protein [Colwellia sp.]|nr:metallo-mystery pair system four-Cys motif protein [Colwellia sp.]